MTTRALEPTAFGQPLGFAKIAGPLRRRNATSQKASDQPQPIKGGQAAYGPHKTIYNRFIRWSRLGVFNRILAALAAKGGRPDQSISTPPT